MAFTRVHNNGSFSSIGTAVSVIMTGTVTSGNLLVVVGVGANATETLSVSDSHSNSYTPVAITSALAGFPRLYFWYAIANATASLTITVTGTSSGQHIVQASEYSFTGTLLTDNTNTGTASPSGGSSFNGIQPAGVAAATELLVSCAAENGSLSSGYSTTPSSPWSQAFDDSGTPSSIGLAVYDVVNGGSGTATPVWAGAGSFNVSLAGISFYISGSPPPPTPPSSRQPDQRIDPLPDFSAPIYQQQRRQPIPITFTPVQDKPTPHQASQIQIVLPNPNQEWLIYQVKTLTALYKPDVPKARQPSQQQSYQLPDYDYTPYEQWRRQPVVTGAMQVTSAQQGQFGIYNTVIHDKLGAHRVANSGLAGYTLYVGLGAIPNLIAGPTAYSATLPFSYTLPLPGSGTRTYYLLVRSRNQYGLESQNQHYTTLTLDSSGNQIVATATPPANLQLFALAGGTIRVLADYPGFNTDASPATTWHVWISASPINTANPPQVIVDVLDSALATDQQTYTPGTWYIGVALFRSSDSTLSNLLSGTIFIPAVPSKPTPVAGGFQQ